MLLLGKFFLFVAALVGFLAAPMAFGYLFVSFPDTLLAELQKYQPISAGLIALFAASLATFGVLATIGSQRQNLERARIVEQERVAAAFIGELSVIVEMLEDETPRNNLQKTVDAVETTTGPINVTTMRIEGPTKYYDSAPGNVGMFPNPLPEQLTRFYDRYENVKSNLERYSSAAEEVFLTGNLPKKTSNEWVIHSMKAAIKDIDYCASSGRQLITELDQIRTRT
jgi:hypothetical protein